MKTTVLKRNAFFFLYTAEMLIPSFFTGSITSKLNHLFLLLGILFLISRKYCPKKYMLAVIGYFAVLVGITFYRYTDRAGLSFVLENARLVVYLATVDCMLTIDHRSATSILRKIIGFYVVLDFLSIVCFPRGLTTAERVWNEWTTTYEAIWLYGRKNNRIHWYMITSLLSTWKYGEEKNAKTWVSVWFYMLLMTAVPVLESSSTSVIVALTADIAIFICLRKKGHVKKVNAKAFLIGYAMLAVMLVLGSVAFLQPIVEGLFHKDLSFSGRTAIWAQICMFIARKPILGYGVSYGSSTAALLGAIDRTSAHNQWLDFLYQGGIVLFAVGTYVYYKLWKSVDNQEDRKNKFLLSFFLIAVSINMLFEAQFNTIKFELLMLLIYRLAQMRRSEA